MQFKNPLILYALFLLLIPIIIHLFQLRRFKKIDFTNVAFLEAVVKNTRKSSILKKWLVLGTRLLALSTLILAFAQPFLPNSSTALKKKDTVIYLDNSFSMQAKGDKGPLLTEAIQDLITNSSTEYTLVTNDETFKDIDPIKDQNTILDIDYSSEFVDPSALNLKLLNAFKDDPTFNKDLFIISDFQNFETDKLDSLKNISQHWVKLDPIDTQNILLDSLTINRVNEDYELIVSINLNKETAKKVPVSLYNEDKLVAKATATFEKENVAQVKFKIPSKGQFFGRLTINDPSLPFDNSFYFNIEAQDLIHILSINSVKNEYLKKIYSGDEYAFTSVQLDKLSYDLIEEQEVIILNEIQSLPVSLINRLIPFKEQGGQVIIIPSSKAASSDYDALLRAFNTSTFGSKKLNDGQITSINYDHPLYDNVFERKADNFQYPSVSTYFEYKRGSNVILRLQDGNSFLSRGENIFVFSGSLNATNSNFQESPLIVPTFEEMAKTALSVPKTYYFLGKNNSFDVKTIKNGDAVYQLRKDEQITIPMQENKGNAVTISTQQAIDKDGIYEILLRDSVVGHVAFNYDRRESLLVDNAVNIPENRINYDSLAAALTTVARESGLNLFYKWFIIFALFFLLCEMLLLKYLK
ncbi:MAG: BatA domain-containing protein [Leeuwenhoekiella sp.]